MKVTTRRTPAALALGLLLCLCTASQAATIFQNANEGGSVELSNIDDSQPNQVPLVEGATPPAAEAAAAPLPAAPARNARAKPASTDGSETATGESAEAPAVAEVAKAESEARSGARDPLGTPVSSATKASDMSAQEIAEASQRYSTLKRENGNTRSGSTASSRRYLKVDRATYRSGLGL